MGEQQADDDDTADRLVALGPEDRLLVEQLVERLGADS